ncbi:MAG: hypothetical protein MZV49_23010 [Rhodopseudomonas palustris]|nr:hypothetical protein [Rhodopseudomonas palustris]
MVGKPLAQLLLNENCHGDHCPFAQPRSAGAVPSGRSWSFAAVGRPEMVQGRLDQAGRHA